MSDVVDILPRIRRRKQSTCPHDHVLVSMEDACVECGDCGAELDVWKVLRDQVDDAEAENKRRRKYEAEIEARVREANEYLAKLRAEVEELHRVRNELINTKIGDIYISSVVSKMRRAAERKRAARR